MSKKLLRIELDKDYRLKGYFKREEDTYFTDPTNSSFDAKGDLVKVEYYREYDEVNKIYSKIAVSEDRVYTRGTDGLLQKKVTTHKWFDELGNIVGEKITTKYYSNTKAFHLQKRSSNVLIDRASMYLMKQLITDNGDTVIGITKAKNFLAEVNNEIILYIYQNKQPLLDAIANTTNTDITQTIKDTLTSILNINYV